MARKTILQAILLVLLLAAGAVLYFARQDGGLDAVMALLGRETQVRTIPAAKPPAAQAPKPAARARAKPSVPAPRPASAPAAPAIPAHTARGDLGGERFVADEARIESGVLTLRQREPALGLQILLPGNPWEAPAGRRIEVLAPDARSADTPLVRVRAGTGGDARVREFAERFTLWLEFGSEQGGALPGKIHLALPDEAGSRVVGTFNADVRGFRFIDGKPDLSADSIDTLEYLALREILESDPQQPLDDLAFGGGRLSAEDGAPAGYLEARYRANGQAVRHAFRFTKAGGQWRVIGTHVGPAEAQRRSR